MLNFTAIDFETANPRRGSPCAVGVVQVRDGRIYDQQSTLIKPPRETNYFTARNIGIHHITPSMVEHAPPWSEVIEWLVMYVRDDILVAHNAAFDSSVIASACDIDGLRAPNFRFMCSVSLSRALLPQLPDHKLPTVVQAVAGEMINHHDALADSEAVALIVPPLARSVGASTIHDLAALAGVSIDSLRYVRISTRGARAKSADASCLNAVRATLLIDFVDRKTTIAQAKHFSDHELEVRRAILSFALKEAKKQGSSDVSQVRRTYLAWSAACKQRGLEREYSYMRADEKRALLASIIPESMTVA